MRSLISVLARLHFDLLLEMESELARRSLTFNTVPII
jgi:hypothetical protein